MPNESTLRRIREQLRDRLPELASAYGVESLALFGSYVRGEQGVESDLDLLVTFRQTPGLIEFVRLENYLGDVLGVKVDLVMKDGLKPRIGRRILDEAVPI